MINLIATPIRVNNRYALRNVRLIRYTVVSAFTMAAIGLITGASILNMKSTQDDLQNQIDAQNQQMASYKKVQDQGKQLSDQLSTINTLLNRQVTFSELLPGIAKVLPPGAVLRQLDFSTSDILSTPGASSASTGSSSQKKPFVIQAAVTDRNVAGTLLENIKASTDLFTDADLVSVSHADTSTSGSPDSPPSITKRYPYQVTINAYLKKLDVNKLNLTTLGGSKP